MKKVTFFISILILSVLCRATEKDTSSKHLLLSVRPASAEEIKNIQKGADPALKKSGTVKIFGRIDAPNFSISDVSQIKLITSGGDEIKMTAWEDSFHSEFGDEFINSLKISFILPKKRIDGEELFLLWGEDISSSKIEKSESPGFYRKSLERYYIFTWEKVPEKNDLADYSTTVEVIVDDQSDLYHYWYLLPMLLIFIMLFIRKYTRK